MIHPKRNGEEETVLTWSELNLETPSPRKLPEKEDTVHNLISLAALQLAELQLTQQRKFLLKSGYLRKAGRRGHWRFERVELRCEDNLAWLIHATIDNEDRSRPNKRRPTPPSLASITAGTAIKRKLDRRNSDQLILNSFVPSLASTERSQPKSNQRAICLVPGKTHCNISEINSSSFSLEILSDSDESTASAEEEHHVSLWMTASESERNEWMQAILALSQAAENNCVKYLKSAEYEPHNLPLDQTESLQISNLNNFNAAVEKAAQAQDRASFVHALIGTAPNDLLNPDPRPNCFRIPLSWIQHRDSISVHSHTSIQQSSPLGKKKSWSAKRLGQKKHSISDTSILKLPVSPHNPHAWTPDFMTCRFTQMRKDMQRDRVRINGELIYAATETYYQAVAAVLAQNILETAHAIPSSKKHPVPGEMSALSESSALIHAIAVLASGARTFSGGDAYACVHALCPGDHAVLCPLSSSASPLEISVSIGKSKSQSEYRCNDKTERLSKYGIEENATPTSLAQRIMASLTSSPSYSRSESFSQTVSSPLTRSSTSTIPCHDNDHTANYPHLLDAVLQEFHRSSDDTHPLKNNLIDQPRVDLALRATTDYKICTTNPQDLPSDTWLVVRAVWTRTFSIFGESTAGAHSFQASEAFVDIAIADAAFVPLSVLNDEEAYCHLFSTSK